MFIVTPLLRFVGEVYTGENVSIIFGSFALPKATKILVACFIGFVWSAVIRTCFLNPNFDVLGNVIMFTAILQKKRMEEVVEFIQKNLTN